MHKRSLYRYYGFGYNYNNLKTRINEPSKYRVKAAIDLIDQYLGFIDGHDLKVTKVAVGNGLLSIKNDLVKLDQNGKLDPSDASRIENLITSVDTTLDSELKLQFAYILTEKRLGLDRLLGKNEEFFADGVYPNLPENVKYDFSEAGYCIAFERPTAAAFHMLRGCEGMLKTYYLYKVKRNRLKDKDMMWGPMIDQLKTKRGIPKPLLGVLDDIRVNFRNPTAHPAARYELDEVQNLFTLCADSINRVVKDMKVKPTEVKTSP